MSSDEEKQERSESGNPIHRYGERSKPFEASAGNPGDIELISRHIEKHIGKVDMVFHELMSDLVHIDVHHVKPGNDRNFHTLITSGMSERPMNSPEELDGWDYAELVVLLPPDWKLDQEDFADENNYWPVRWLKILARFPHEYDTWFSYGHTIPNGDPATPFAPSVGFDTMLLMPSITLPDEFQTLDLSDERVIRFYTLMPLYSEEVKLKLAKGTDALFDKFEQFAISDIVDINRPNTCKKKGLWGLFK